MVGLKRSRQACRKYGLVLGLGLATLSLGACATIDSALEWVGYSSTSAPASPEAMVSRAMEDFNRGKYSSALKGFEEIRDRFPFSDVALLAELKSADANFHLEKYGEARVLYEGFEAAHPSNEAVPYVLFQIGMCYYKQISTIDRDPGSATNAVQAFERLNRSFPQSPYFEEASARIRAALDFLAQHEFSVASFYVRTDEYSQAQRRLEYLLATYPGSSVTPPAEKLLAQLRSGKPIEKSWLRFVPSISLPDWRTMSSAFGLLPGGSGGETATP